MRAKLFGLLAIGGLVILTGCGGPPPAPTSSPDKPAGSGKEKETEHEGWWCDEHGIPEHECSMCMSPKKQQTMFKDKGDWCQEHQRAKTQCFKCDPTLKEKFAAKYKAHYGPDAIVPPIGEEVGEKK